MSLGSRATTASNSAQTCGSSQTTVKGFTNAFDSASTNFFSTLLQVRGHRPIEATLGTPRTIYCRQRIRQRTHQYDQIASNQNGVDAARSVLIGRYTQYAGAIHVRANGRSFRRERHQSLLQYKCLRLLCSGYLENHQKFDRECRPPLHTQYASEENEWVRSRADISTEEFLSAVSPKRFQRRTLYPAANS